MLTLQQTEMPFLSAQSHDFLPLRCPPLATEAPKLGIINEPGKNSKHYCQLSLIESTSLRLLKEEKMRTGRFLEGFYHLHYKFYFCWV